MRIVGIRFARQQVLSCRPQLDGVGDRDHPETRCCLTTACHLNADTLVSTAAYHHFSGRALNAAAASIAAPTLKQASSSRALLMTCRPRGRPCASIPAGTAIAGRPARFAV